MFNKFTVFRFVLTAFLITLLAGSTAYASRLLNQPQSPAQEQSISVGSSSEPNTGVLAQVQPVVLQPAANTQNQPVISQVTGAAGTSFQQSLKKAIEDRKAQGLPVPVSVDFEYNVADKTAPESKLNSSATGVEANVVITSKTIVTIQNPAQAGYEKWPDLVFQNDDLDGAKGFVKSGNYNQEVKDYLAQQLPGIWDQYEFGYEPRQYTFEETYQVNYSEAELNNLIVALQNAPDAASIEQILLGFTYNGPNINYTINEKFETCFILCVTWAEFNAGFALDWGLGLRLPMEVTLDSPDPVTEGTLFNPTTSIKGLNWSASDYTAAGVPPENGNEFVMRFNIFLGGSIKILGAEILGASISSTVAESRSFVTPFGPGASFPIPTLNIPIWQPDLAVASLTFGFGFKPDLVSDKITADWSASLDASGTGSVTYTDSAVPVAFGPVNPINGPGQADLLLQHYRYWFSKFLMEISAFIDFDVFGFDAARIDIPITDFDLSFITNGLFVKAHDGTLDNVTKSVAILDLPAVVSAGPDQVVNEGSLVNLAPAAFTDVGVLDVHTATVNWGDGTVEAVPVLEAAGVGTVSKSHAYGDNGVYNVVVSVCEGLACGTDTLVVTVNNVAPVTGAGADVSVNEGDAFNLAPAAFTDPGFLDTETAKIDWGDGSAVEPGVVTFSAGSGTVSGSHVFLDDGLYTVKVEVCDDDGGCGADTLVVTVLNVAPAVSSISAPDMLLVGTMFTASASFTDPGVLDTHTALWDWGDGLTQPGTLTQGAGFGSVADTHAYLTCQVFTINLSVTDDDGGVGSAAPHTVNVLSPKDGIQKLMDMVSSLGLDHGIENALLSKLGNALDALDRGQSNPTENMLGAFINQVEAQRGKKIAEADADMLIQWAEDIIAALQGGLCLP